jgi:hypothetical protein
MDQILMYLENCIVDNNGYGLLIIQILFM